MVRYDRAIYEVARIPDGHKVGNFHIPLTLDGYRRAEQPHRDQQPEGLSGLRWGKHLDLIITDPGLAI